MALTDTDEFTVYNTFNTTGIVTSDTFNSWRKKTNGIINELDLPVAPSKLSLGAPTWTTNGNLSTYLDGTTRGSFTVGAITCTSLNAGSGSITTTGSISVGGIIGSSLKVGGSVSTPATGAVNSLSLAVGTSNTQFTVSAAGAVTAASLITGSSLKVGGSVTTPASGAVNSLSLAVGTNNTEFSVNSSGLVTTAAATIPTGGNPSSGLRILTSTSSSYIYGLSGSGQDGATSTIANLRINSWYGIGFGPSISGQTVPQWENAVWIDCREGNLSTRNAFNSKTLAVGTNNTQFTVSAAGAIVGTSLNAGSGTIQTTGNAIAATPTLSTHLTTKGYVDGMFSYGTLNSPPFGTTWSDFEFTSIPSTVKRITIMLGGVSTNGTNQITIVLGDSGGYEVTGYISSVSRNGGTFASTTSFAITEYTNSTDNYYGSIVLTRFVPDVNTWILSGSVNSINDSRVHSSSGIKGLSGSLDKIKVTTVGATANLFDGGSVNIMYEY